MSRSPTNRRLGKAILGPEALESRALMTGGVGNTFAMMPGMIAEPGGSAEVRISVGPEHFLRPGGRIILGIDVAPDTNSTVDPTIRGVSASPGAAVAGTNPVRRLSGPRVSLMRTPMSSAVLATFSDPQGRGDATHDYAVKVGGLKSTSGSSVVGFYLPGDANGDGVVNEADAKVVKQSLGTTVDHVAYNFDADGNRDGRINGLDVALTRYNRGAGTSINPVLSANLAPASDTGEQDRITTAASARFDGIASPGATILYTEVDGKVSQTQTKADALGNYQIEVGLAPGINTFRVTSLDPFGQSISGQISPVVRQT